MNYNDGPDRINCTKEARRVIDDIDEKKFLGLDSSNTSRSELFTYAMSIGIDTCRTKLMNIYTGGLILDKSIDSKMKSLMYGYVVSELSNPDTLDEITIKENVYSIAQELANTGFSVIDNYIESKKEENLVWELVQELDILYSKNVE